MILKRTTFAVAFAVLVLGMAASLKYAQSLDLIAPDAAKRTMQVTIGLMLGCVRQLDAEGCRALAGIGAGDGQVPIGAEGRRLVDDPRRAGLRRPLAFAPLAFADVASMVVVASAMVITAGYAGRSLLACRSSKTAAS